MTDGTTAMPISPIQEDDTMIAERWFKRAAQAIVDATNLETKLQAISKSLDELKMEIEYVRSRNRELDQTLHDVRGQRDSATAELSSVKGQLAEANRSLTEANTNIERINEINNRLNADLINLRHERDDYGMKNMELSDALDKANAKLADIEGFARKAFGLGKSAKPLDLPNPIEPKPQPEMAPVTHYDDTDPRSPNYIPF